MEIMDYLLEILCDMPLRLVARWKGQRDSFHNDAKLLGGAFVYVHARGCLLGMQDLLGRHPDVVSTPGGYSGGDATKAMNRNHGTHAEASTIEKCSSHPVIIGRQLRTLL
jgi:hypothetical protein